MILGIQAEKGQVIDSSFCEYVKNARKEKMAAYFSMQPFYELPRVAYEILISRAGFGLTSSRLGRWMLSIPSV